jgi:hypothetical protein
MKARPKRRFTLRRRASVRLCEVARWGHHGRRRGQIGRQAVFLVCNALAIIYGPAFDLQHFRDRTQRSELRPAEKRQEPELVDPRHLSQGLCGPKQRN